MCPFLWVLNKFFAHARMDSTFSQDTVVLGKNGRHSFGRAQDRIQAPTRSNILIAYQPYTLEGSLEENPLAVKHLENRLYILIHDLRQFCQFGLYCFCFSLLYSVFLSPVFCLCVCFFVIFHFFSLCSNSQTLFNLVLEILELEDFVMNE